MGWGKKREEVCVEKQVSKQTNKQRDPHADLVLLFYATIFYLVISGNYSSFCFLAWYNDLGSRELIQERWRKLLYLEENIKLPILCMLNLPPWISYTS